MNLLQQYNKIILFQIGNSLKFHRKRKDDRNKLRGQSTENITTT